MTDFDAIVVGSGMSGGWVAKELCERGLKVAVVERGRQIDRAKDFTDLKHPWELENFGRPTSIDAEEYPVQSNVYAFTPDTRQLWVKDLEAPYETPQDRPYNWFRGHQEGGRSIMWGRQSYRFSEIDFEANKRDGHGVDWPVRYKELAPWYDHVERFAGIAGSQEGLDILPDGVFQPPFEMNCGEVWLKENLESEFPQRKVIPARVANLTAPTEEQRELGRGKCQVRNRCHRGCSFNAYFSSLSATLPAAERTGNYTLLSDRIVTSVNYDSERNRVSGINITHAKNNSKETLTARLVFLNASTIATSVILLNSKSETFPNGLANRSGQVGRNLMDHINGPSAVGFHFGMTDKYYKGNRPSSIYIPRYRNHTEEGDGYLRGFGFQGGAMRLGWGFKMFVDGSGIGSDFKEKIREPGTWTFQLGAFCEMLPNEKNQVRLHPTKNDKFGAPVPLIDVQYGENDKALARQAQQDARDMLDRSGCYFVNSFLPDEEPWSPPGNGIHEMGTARMGKDPKSSVLNKWNQAHDVPNLFVTDGSFMASAGCQNPSLTYMAFSARAADYAAKQVAEGKL